MSATEDAARRATLRAIRHRTARGAGDVGRRPADVPPLRVRVVGSAEDVAEAVEAIRQVLDVEHVSAPFPSRQVFGDVRVYVHAAPRASQQEEEACASG